MAEVNLGRIGFVNQGSWNSSVDYKINDVVKYGGSNYAAKRQNTGVTPPTDGTDTDDWFYFVNNSDYVDKTSNQEVTGIKNFINGIKATEIIGETTFTESPIAPTPTTEYQVANKKYVDDKTIINNFTDKLTPVNTDNLVLQEVGGDLKKVSFQNLTKLSPNDSRVKTALNASGDAPIYACRAWVNFNGTGTVAIRASGNVSSITDRAIGRYTVNFATAMPDLNYVGQVTTYLNGADDRVEFAGTITSFPVRTGNADWSPQDYEYINVTIFG